MEKKKKQKMLDARFSMQTWADPAAAANKPPD
jgi:hypothetical protein